MNIYIEIYSKVIISILEAKNFVNDFHDSPHTVRECYTHGCNVTNPP